jgi:hypothetical protein
MSQEQNVKVTIRRDGTMSIELANFVGDQCDALDELESQLGVVTHKEDTADRSLYEIPDPNFLNIES